MIPILVAGAVSLLAAFLGVPLLLRPLVRLGVGQQIREDGPERHKAKAGTPTMGGLAIVAATLVGWLAAHLVPNTPFSVGGWLVVLALVGGAAIGFADDLLKVSRRRSLGLNKRSKFGAQLLLGGIVALLALEVAHVSPVLAFTRLADPVLALPAWAWAIWAVFVMTGSSNAVNLTDGLDGLAAGATALAASCLVVAGYFQFRHYGVYHIPDALDLSLATASLLGACVGFLWWNTAPARIIMGDTGSLAIGSALAAIALELKLDLLYPIVVGLFIVVTLSVVLQVASYRLFGRRIFRMAPLHHHFELLGWPETTIIVRFWIVAGLFGALGLGLFYSAFIASRGGL